MENQPTQLDKAVKISIIAGALVIALSVAYCLVIFLPKKEAIRLEQQKQDQEEKKQAKDDAEWLKNAKEKELTECLDGANLAFNFSWDYECKSRGLMANCSSSQMPKDITEKLNKENSEMRNECFRMYK